MGAPSEPESVGERRIARRALLGLPVRGGAAQWGELTVSQYAGWIAQYRRGRLQDVASQVRFWGSDQLLSAQRKYLRALGQPGTLHAWGEHNLLRVFQARLTSALFHAEVVAQFGEGLGHRLDLVGAPLRAIPAKWPLVAPSSWREAAREAWGDRLTENFGALLRREVILMAARSRLARLDNANARQVLEYASPNGDPVVEWQFAITSVIQARYLRDRYLWPDAQRQLRGGVGRWERSRLDMGRSRRAIAQAMGDPDDLNLRLAMVALGRRRHQVAAGHLEEVRPEVAPRLLVPRLLLRAELDLRQERIRPALEGLRHAVRSEPTSPAALVALVAAQQAAGRWDEAAALASDFLSVRERQRPWLAFITTWAEFGEGLSWLREVAGIA